MKKQKKTIQKAAGTLNVSSSPCDMARFADYFLGLDKKPKKLINAKQKAKSKRQS